MLAALSTRKGSRRRPHRNRPPVAGNAKYGSNAAPAASHARISAEVRTPRPRPRPCRSPPPSANAAARRRLDAAAAASAPRGSRSSARRRADRRAATSHDGRTRRRSFVDVVAGNVAATQAAERRDSSRGVLAELAEAEASRNRLRGPRPHPRRAFRSSWTARARRRTPGCASPPLSGHVASELCVATRLLVLVRPLRRRRPGRSRRGGRARRAASYMCAGPRCEPPPLPSSDATGHVRREARTARVAVAARRDARRHAARRTPAASRARPPRTMTSLNDAEVAQRRRRRLRRRAAARPPRAWRRRYASAGGRDWPWCARHGDERARRRPERQAGGLEAAGRRARLHGTRRSTTATATTAIREDDGYGNVIPKHLLTPKGDAGDDFAAHAAKYGAEPCCGPYHGPEPAEDDGGEEEALTAEEMATLRARRRADGRAPEAAAADARGDGGGARGAAAARRAALTAKLTRNGAARETHLWRQARAIRRAQFGAQFGAILVCICAITLTRAPHRVAADGARSRARAAHPAGHEGARPTAAARLLDADLRAGEGARRRSASSGRRRRAAASAGALRRRCSSRRSSRTWWRSRRRATISATRSTGRSAIMKPALYAAALAAPPDLREEGGAKMGRVPDAATAPRAADSISLIPLLLPP